MLVEEPLSDHFRGFAAVAERDGGTTYAAISRGVAEDDEVLVAARPGGPPPAPAAHLVGRGALPAALGRRGPAGGVLRHGTGGPRSDRRHRQHRHRAAAGRSHRGVPRLLPGPPERARGADRHPQHPDQRGRTLHRTVARTLPHRVALGMGRAALAARSRDLGRAQPALRRLRLHLPECHRGGHANCGAPRVGRPAGLRGPRRRRQPARAAPAGHGRAGRPRPLTGRPVLRRGRTVVAGLPVAG